MHSGKTLLVGTFTVLSAAIAQSVLAQSPTSFVSKLGVEMDVRSGGAVLRDEALLNQVILPELAGPVTGGASAPQIQLRGGNTQVNDPAGDVIQNFSGFRPFVRATQSEVSAAAFGRNVVVTYNNSAGIHVSQVGNGLVIDQVKLSGFSTSNDGGQTWTSGFIPPAAGASQTFGDPSIAVDRRGVFYFANLGATATHGSIQVNKSVDGGRTWSDGIVVQEDDESDKEWIAVGPDPTVKSRDNVYVTWTSFQDDACELRFGRSTDGGATFTAKTILTPTADANPQHPQNCLQFSNPVVDQVTGTLYVPFLRFSNADQDFIQMLKSDDAGETFTFVKFNVSGAPDATLIPVTQPGELTSCGGTQANPNIRLTIHGSAAPSTPGFFGLPRYINASRQVLQPAMAARNGTLYLAWPNSTSLVLGDPSGGSNVLFIRSTDGGATWSAPIQVNPTVAGDKHHVLPALAMDVDPNDVHVTFYTQHANGTIDVDMANSHDGGLSFPAIRTVRVTSTSMNLPPTNIPLANLNATNYDRQIQPCYALGEYQSVFNANGSLFAAWGDTRNTITEPSNNPLDPIAGQTHPQEDVFIQKVKAQ